MLNLRCVIRLTPIIVYTDEKQFNLVKNISMHILLFLSMFMGQLSTTATLTVTVKNVPSSSGTIMIGAYNNAETFTHPTKLYKSKIVKAKKGEVTFKLEVNKGDKIALALYHDKNENKKLDKNMFGVPTEYYGFSNDARGTFSAPSFESAAVVVDGDKSISIKVE